MTSNGNQARTAQAAREVSPAWTATTGARRHLRQSWWRNADGHAGVTIPAMEIEVLPDGMEEEAVSLWHITGIVRSWNDPGEDLRRAMRGTASNVLACTERNELLGTAMVGHDGQRGWVYYLAVAPAHQHQGLGRRLMEACEEWVRDRGVPKIQVMIRRSNTKVLGFYQELGYTDDEVSVVSLRSDK